MADQCEVAVNVRRRLARLDPATVALGADRAPAGGHRRRSGGQREHRVLRPRHLRRRRRAARQRLARAVPAAARARPAGDPGARGRREADAVGGVRALPAGRIRHPARGPLRAAAEGVVQVDGPGHRARHLPHGRDGVRRADAHGGAEQPPEGDGDRDPPGEPAHPGGAGRADRRRRPRPARRPGDPHPAGRHRRRRPAGAGLRRRGGGHRPRADRRSGVAAPPAAGAARPGQGSGEVVPNDVAPGRGPGQERAPGCWWSAAPTPAARPCC